MIDGAPPCHYNDTEKAAGPSQRDIHGKAARLFLCFSSFFGRVFVLKKIVAFILAAVLALSMLSGCGSADSGVTEDGYAKELYLYNWSEYMPEEILTAFEDEYGIRVVQSTFTSNEELLTKLTAGGTSQYDLIVPTNFIVEALVAQNLIQPLDLNNIPNLQNINPQMLDLDFDKGNQYTVPYMATITAAVVNQKKLEEMGVEMPTSMDDFLNPAFENNLVVMDDSRGLIGFALSRSGKSFNETDKDTIYGTLEWLEQLKPNIKAFDSDSPKTMLIANEVAGGFVYGGDAAAAIAENPDIVMVDLKENVSLSLDCFAITSEAQHKREAELFIDFVLRPENGKILAESFPYICVNNAAKELLGEDYLNNPACNVSDEQLAKAEFLNDVGEAVTYFDEVFTQLKN